MSFLQSTTCAAFTWDDHDNYRGIYIERQGDSFKIRNTWQARRVGNQSPAQMLQNGIPALEIGEETTVVVGGNFSKACFIDLKMPKIAAKDLRNALYFELVKYSPLPLDDIQWGYRIIGKVDHSDLNLIRIVYFSQGEWESWVAAASGINDGVDVIIPAIAVLDPLMNGTDVCLEKLNGSQPFLLNTKENGERQINCLSPAEVCDPIFGYGETPLMKENLDLGTLSDLSPEIQQSFTTAAILGMYGVSDSYNRDKKSWLSVPFEMRPKRNRAHKIYTIMLIVYLFFLSGILISSTYYEKHKEYWALDAEYRRLQERAEKFEVQDDATTFVEELEIEINEMEASIFSMTKALIEVTTLTNDQLWSSNFNWDVDEIRLELRSDAERSDLTESLQESLLLTDITMRKRQLSDESINYTINCRVAAPGKDTPKGESDDSVGEQESKTEGER